MSAVSDALALAIAHHQAGRLKGAEASYRLVLQMQPDHSQACANLGSVLSELERHEEAAEHFKRASHLRPDDPVAWYNLGNAFRNQEKLDEAIECYCRALSLKPAYADANNNLGLTLKDQGKVDEAVSAFRRALEHTTPPPMQGARTTICFMRSGSVLPVIRRPFTRSTGGGTRSL